MTESQAFHYIIVGAGSAGCVLANRLSADPNIRVALIEAGPSDQPLATRLLVDVPVGILSLIRNPKYNWMYQFAADPRRRAGPVPCPRGRVLGGTSAINGMVYVRGQPEDYDGWAANGAPGWSFEEVLPFFKRSEKWHGARSDWHGTEGELDVSALRSPNPVHVPALRAAEQAGFRRNPDFNGPEQEGFGLYHVTQKRGERVSTSRAFLRPVRHRANLVVFTDACAERILVEEGAARGIAVRVGGERLVLRAHREIVVAAGAINSPALLLHSGIGAAEKLVPLGIPLVHDLPGVGENLQDHQNVVLCYASPHSALYGLSWRAAPWMAAAPFSYLFARRGPFSTNTVEIGAFLRSRPDSERPDLQFTLAPELLNQPERLIPVGHGFTVLVTLLNPESRGRVSLRSPDASDPPTIDGNFLSSPADEDTLLRGVGIARQWVGCEAFDGYRGAELVPGAKVASPEATRCYVRSSVNTIYHPAGTCKMGRDMMAVVDPELRVRGIAGLRVADASIMPTITRGNTNAPAIMIGEKASALIQAAWAYNTTPSRQDQRQPLPHLEQIGQDAENRTLSDGRDGAFHRFGEGSA